MSRKPCWLSRRPVSRWGTGLLPFLFLMVAFATACSGSGGAFQDQELEDGSALGLPRGARLHRITLGGRGSVEHAVPTRVPAVPGDGVEFLSVDHRVHTVTFPSDSLAPEVLAFLQRTNQLSSLPLVSRGSRFILRLRNAPVGRYVFVSEGHGGRAYGVIEIGSPAEADTTHTRSD